MALITDPDVLSGNTIQINYGASPPTVRLSACESLSTDGVTIKCVYSKLKELWKSNETYIMYPFPMVPITDEQFEMANTWDWYDNSTRYLLRTGGWAKKSPTGVSEQEWAGIVGLGSLGGTDQVYFQQGAATEAGSAAVNFQLTGQINQAISIYSSGGVPGTYDYRSYLKLFCREWQKAYATSQLSDIGVTTLTYQAYRFPLSNSTDIKVTHAMSAMSAAPYDTITATWYAGAQSRTIGTSADNFHVIIDGADRDAEEIYERIQYLLTLNDDIDSGSLSAIGKTAPALLRFVGDTMYTMFYTIPITGGTYIDNFQDDDINRLVFTTDTGLERTFPYTAVLTLNFGENLENDAEAKYWVYFTDVPGGNYGDDDAILVNTANSVATSARARTGTTVTLTAQADHGLSAGDGIVVSSMAGSGYNGTWVVVSTPHNRQLTFVSTVTSSETYVPDVAGTILQNMSGKVNSQESYQKSFEYDTNDQGGRTPVTEAPVTAVAIGLSTGQFVKTTGTIQRSTANSVSLVAPLERNYQNP